MCISCIFTKKNVCRLSFEEFLDRYELFLLPGSADTLSRKGRCKAIISQEFGVDNKENLLPCHKPIKIGKRKLFLKGKQLEKLEKEKRQIIDKNATRIQRAWRKFRRMKLKQRAAVTIQAGFRGWKSRTEIRRMNEAAKIIQHALIMYHMKKEQERLEEQEKLENELKRRTDDINASCIQKAWRQFKQRKHQELKLRAAVTIQAGFRGRKARMEINEIRRKRMSNTTETTHPCRLPRPYKYTMFPPSLWNLPIYNLTPQDSNVNTPIDEIDLDTDQEESDIDHQQGNGNSSAGDLMGEELKNTPEDVDFQPKSQRDSSSYDIIKYFKISELAMGVTIAGLLWNGPIII